MIECPLAPRVSVCVSLHNWFLGVHYHWEDETLTLGVLPLVTIRVQLGTLPVSAPQPRPARPAVNLAAQS